jgi:hypothetical protein
LKNFLCKFIRILLGSERLEFWVGVQKHSYEHFWCDVLCLKILNYCFQVEGNNFMRIVLLDKLKRYLSLDSVENVSELGNASQHLKACIHVACVSDVDKSESFDLSGLLFHFLLDFDLSSGLQFLSDFGSHNDQGRAFGKLEK